MNAGNLTLRCIRPTPGVGVDTTECHYWHPLGKLGKEYPQYDLNVLTVPNWLAPHLRVLQHDLMQHAGTDQRVRAEQ